MYTQQELTGKLNATRAFVLETYNKPNTSVGCAFLFHQLCAKKQTDFLKKTLDNTHKALVQAFEPSLPHNTALGKHAHVKAIEEQSKIETEKKKAQEQAFMDGISLIMIRDQSERTTLHIAVILRECVDEFLSLLKAMIKYQAQARISFHNPLTYADEDGMTPMMYALGHNNFVLIKKLLEAGYPLNDPNIGGYTILQYAINTQNTTLYNLLSTAFPGKLDLSAKSLQGDTALHCAIQSVTETSLAAITKQVGFLLKGGANPCAQDSNKKHPLALLPEGRYPVLEKMLREAITKRLWDLLKAAKKAPDKTDYAAIKECLDAGADATVLEENGENMIHYIARFLTPEVMTLVLKKNKYLIQQRNKQGEPLLTSAQANLLSKDMVRTVLAEDINYPLSKENWRVMDVKSTRKREDTNGQLFEHTYLTLLHSVPIQEKANAYMPTYDDMAYRFKRRNSDSTLFQGMQSVTRTVPIHFPSAGYPLVEEQAIANTEKPAFSVSTNLLPDPIPSKPVMFKGIQSAVSTMNHHDNKDKKINIII